MTQLQIDKYAPITTEQAERQIVVHERTLEALVNKFHPEQIAVMATKRLRGLDGPRALNRNPPHALVRVVEAGFAYGSPWPTRPPTNIQFQILVDAALSVDEPIMAWLLEHEGFMPFWAFAHQSQLRLLRSMWIGPMGRATWLFADANSMPALSGSFSDRFGITPRQWLQCAFIVHSMSGKPNHQPWFGHAFVERFRGTQLPPEIMLAFLTETSRTPSEIRHDYRMIRAEAEPGRRGGPLTWYQRPAILARHPLIKLPAGWAVPSPLLLTPLFDELLFTRLTKPDQGESRAELSNRFTDYIERVLRAHLMDRLTVQEAVLKARGSGKVCDLAIDLPNATLLIEAKSVIFDRNSVTENALASGSAQEIIDGMIQVAETAIRIKRGGCAECGIDLRKPIIGLVVTLGDFPHANDPRLFDLGAPEFEARGLAGPSLTEALHCRPIVLDADALDFLVLFLRRNPTGLPGLITEYRQADIHQVGDWPDFLHRKVRGGQGHDISFWRGAADQLLIEFGSAR